MKSYSILLLLFMLIAQSALAAVYTFAGRPILYVASIPPQDSYNHAYYVSGTGNDSSSGFTTNTAFATLAKAATVATNGDTIYLVSGGGLITTSNVTFLASGIAGSPIRITSTDPNNLATVFMPYASSDTFLGTPNGIYLPNNQFMQFDHFIFKGPGFDDGNPTTNSTVGIASKNPNANGTYLDGVTFTNMVMSGWLRAIQFYGSNALTGWTNIAIVDCVLTNNNYEGVIFVCNGNPVGTCYKNPYIAGCNIGNFYGYIDNGHARCAGALVVFSTASMICVSNFLHDGAATGTQPAGAGGVTANFCTNAVIEWNISSNWRSTPAGVDGYGLNVGPGAYNSVIRYNLCFSNDSGGIIMVDDAINTLIEGNTTYANCLRGDYGEIGFLSSGPGGGSNARVVNNTCVSWLNDSGARGGLYFGYTYFGTNLVANNVFISRASNIPVVELASSSASSIRLLQNIYWNPTNDANTKFISNGSTYTGLAAWEAALGYGGSGIVTNPTVRNLNMTSGADTLTVAELRNMTTFRLSTNSLGWHTATNMMIRNSIPYTNDMSFSVVNTNAFNIGSWEPNYN